MQDVNLRNQAGVTSADIAARYDAPTLDKSPALSRLAGARSEGDDQWVWPGNSHPLSKLFDSLAKTRSPPLLPPAPPTTSKPNIREVVTAFFSYSGTEEGDLSFTVRRRPVPRISIM